jgi:hypothetical protein
MKGAKYRLWMALAALGFAAVGLLTSCRSSPKASPDVFKGGSQVESSAHWLELDEALADLDYFFRTVEKVHFNPLAQLSKRDYVLLKERLRSPLAHSAVEGGQISKVVLALTLAEAAAALGDGHTYCHLSWDLLETNKDEACIPPFRLDWRAGEVVIGDSVPALQSWKGARLVGINGLEWKEALRPILDRISGERWEHRMADFLRQQDLYWALIRPEPGTEIRLTLQQGLGEPQVAKVGLISLAKYRREVPSQPERPSWGYHEFYNDGRICYWQYNSCNATAPARAWMEAVFREIRERRAEVLVLDLRFNSGGNDAACRAIIDHLTDKPYRMYSRIGGRISEAFLRQTSQWYLRPFKGLRLSFARSPKKPKEVANRFGGKVYALTSPYTFSAAADMAHVLKDYRLATIVGEETGGARECFGEACGERAPNSGLGFSVSCKVFYAPIPRPDDSKRGTVPDIVLTEALLAPFKGLDDPERSFTFDLISKHQIGR